MPPVYFNDIEPFAAEWLANIGKETHIDTRSIAQIAPADVAGFRRVHFFAGIGGWELALQLAGWPEDEEIWTGSCPCQPFSVAGKRGGTADERHLWPEFFRLVKACRPKTIFGEQVASAEVVGTSLEAAFVAAVQRGDYAAANRCANRIVKSNSLGCDPRWVDGISADLEGIGYTVRTAILGAHSAGAPHIRQRLYWLAKSDAERHNGREDSAGARHPKQHHEAKAVDEYRGLGDTSSEGPQERQDGGRGTADVQRQAAIGNGPWGNAATIHCRDGKSRRISVERGDEPLAYGIPIKAGHIVARLGELGFDPKTARRIIANARRNRTGRLRGYGNAIVPQVAVEFIRSVMEA